MGAAICIGRSARARASPFFVMVIRRRERLLEKTNPEGYSFQSELREVRETAVCGIHESSETVA
jgi:hypothetical protein